MSGFTISARDLWRRSGDWSTKKVSTRLQPLVSTLAGHLVTRGVLPASREQDATDRVVGRLLQQHVIHGALPVAGCPVATILSQLRRDLDDVSRQTLALDQLAAVGSPQEEVETVHDWMELELVARVEARRSRNKDDMWEAWLDLRWVAAQRAADADHLAGEGEPEPGNDAFNRRLSRVREEIDAASGPLRRSPYQPPATDRASAQQWSRIIGFGIDSLYRRMPESMDRSSLQRGDLGVVRHRLMVLARTVKIDDAGDAP